EEFYFRAPKSSCGAAHVGFSGRWPAKREEMSAALPPRGGVHGAQGVVAGGLWVRCGCTAGRSLLAKTCAHAVCVIVPAKSFSTPSGVLIRFATCATQV